MYKLLHLHLFIKSQVLHKHMRKLQLIRNCFAIAILLIQVTIGYTHTAIHNDALSNNVSNFDYLGINNESVKTIVIDPGHGGKDPGCSGSLYKEKDIALEIALKFGHLVKMHYPDMNVIFTRSNDQFIPLYKRINIANQSNADLFISIHCNSFKDPSIYGTETFVMGLHKVDENLEVAKRENASIILEKDFEKNYDGYDPNSPLGHIMLSNYQNAYLNRSLSIAEYVEDNFAHRTDKLSRGVKQAGFVVLKAATMPSILVEAGFLSNKKEEAYLGSQRGQHEIAYSLLNSVEMYMQDQEETTPIVYSNVPKAIRIDEQVRLSASPKAAQQVSMTEAKAPVKPVLNKSIEAAIALKKPTVMYKVQIAASKGKPMKQQDSKWKELTDIEIEQKDGYYKYYHGVFNTIEEANDHKVSLRQSGFKGAFLVKK